MKDFHRVKKMIPWMVISFVIYLLIQVVNLIPSYIMAHIIDVLLPEQNIKRIVCYIVLFVSIPLLTGVGHSYYVYVTAIKCREFSFVYNNEIISNLMGQDMAFHNKNAGSELSAKAMKDVSNYVYIWLCTIPQAVASIMAAAITLLVIGSISWTVALIQLLFIFILVLPVKYSEKIVKKNSKKMFGALVKMRSIVSEAFSGIRYIKTMCIENRVMDRYKIAYAEANSTFGRAVATETVATSGIKDFLSAVFLGIGFIQCAAYVSVNALTIGALVTVISILPRYHMGIVQLVSANLSFKKELAQCEELLSYMDYQTEFTKGKEPEGFLREKLSMKDVDFQYDGKAVLRHFSLDIERNTWTAIEGASGIGKSTVMDILLRLYRPEGGAFTLDGIPVSEIDLRWYRSQVAYVPQDPFLFNGTILDNARLVAPDAAEAEIMEALRGANIYDFVMEQPKGLDTVVGENGVSISGGEKQRLAIALALLTHRPLLLLDEATSNVDKVSEERIRDYLRGKVDRGECTVVSVSHRKEFHSRADAVCHMEGEPQQSGLPA